MTNELSEPAWSGYEQDIPVAQGSVQPAHNGSVAGSNPAVVTNDKQSALDALDEIGAAGFIYELGEHIETIRSALTAPRVPVIDGLDEAIVKFNHFVLTGDSGGACMTYPIEKAARAYAELQKGN